MGDAFDLASMIQMFMFRECFYRSTSHGDRRMLTRESITIRTTIRTVTFGAAFLAEGHRPHGTCAGDFRVVTDEQLIERSFLAYRRKRSAAVAAKLKDALAREAALLHDKSVLLQRQDMLTQELEHRLLNSLQLVIGLLSLQSRRTKNAEAAAQLTTAANRVGALGRV